jgi:hypothetical protein
VIKLGSDKTTEAIIPMRMESIERITSIDYKRNKPGGPAIGTALPNKKCCAKTHAASFRFGFKDGQLAAVTI